MNDPGTSATRECPDELERERFLAGELGPERAGWLEEHRAGCAACARWFEEVTLGEALLGDLREVWSPAPDDSSGLELEAGAALGRYRIVRLIGAGGMGVVYEAEQASPRRRVALKVVRPGLSSSDLLRRFEFEAEILGRLDHEGIARIHEAGTLGSGERQRPFFAMELVEGVPLDRHCDDAGLERAARLRLMERVCEAVEHAHRRGVVHRDLKPANVLVTREGAPKILDFGVARAVDDELQAVTQHARAGQIVGTLAYMAPEQLDGRSDAVESASDVYALGVILFELLTGERPHDLAGRSLASAARVLADEPARSLVDVDPALGGDLATICSHALERDPERRYGSAGELAADLARLRRHEPITARPPGVGRQLALFARRHRTLVAAAAAVLLSLLVGLVVSLRLKVDADRSAALAERERNNVLSLSALVELERLGEQADALWPVRPGLERALLDWIDRADALIASLEPDPGPGSPGHYALREAIRARATDVTDGEYVFADDSDRWWHEQLETLIARIEEFADGESGLVRGISARFGWGVERRLEWARTIERRTVTGPEVAARWAQTVDAIRDPQQTPAYGGLTLAPQLGLVPIGPDPRSGLYEFWHVQSGAEPERGGDGRLVLTEETGIVLVLLPGGSFWMGAQSDDPTAPGYHPAATFREGPLHEVTLSPFFLAKLETTQGQWQRMTASRPSRARPGIDGIDLRHPVEQVTWTDADRTLRRFGLSLPSEAQWEYGARAGTRTPWWTGADEAALARAGNLAEQSCFAYSGSSSWVFEAWDDAHGPHAPVGSFDANPFGLHDTVGNVWEWCVDGLARDYTEVEDQVDPVFPAYGTGSRILRGGGWQDPADAARASQRNSGNPGFAGAAHGLRAARALER